MDWGLGRCCRGLGVCATEVCAGLDIVMAASAVREGRKSRDGEEGLLEEGGGTRALDTVIDGKKRAHLIQGHAKGF